MRLTVLELCSQAEILGERLDGKCKQISFPCDCTTGHVTHTALHENAVFSKTCPTGL